MRWLSDDERLHAISEAPETPKTVTLLASSLRKEKSAQYLPFGKDFEDIDSYNCTECRLLFFAEMHVYNEDKYGTFRRPNENLPYTYRELQDIIMQQRQASARKKGMETADEVASMLCSFASDPLTTHHLIHFALPRHQRAEAYQVGSTDVAHGEVSKETRRFRAVDRERYTASLSHKAAQAMANRFAKLLRC